MWNQLNTTVALCAVSLTAGCYSSDDVTISNIKTDAIYQLYQVNYTAEDNETQVYARLRVGGSRGTNIELSQGSSVKCNGTSLDASSLLGRCYTKALPGFVADVEFVFTDEDASEFRNAVQLRQADFINGMPEKLHRDAGQTMSFDGPPLQQGETVVLQTDIDLAEVAALQLDDPDAAAEKMQQYANSIGQSDQVGATSVELNPAALAELSAGPVRLRWVRAYRGDLQSATPTGGRMSTFYRSATHVITIE